MEDAAKALASEDFSRLRVREILQRAASLLTRRRDHLLPLADVREILGPAEEIYRGVRPVPVKSIVGSEGRYNDFTRSFLPRHRHLRGRWMRVDTARYMDISLPAIRLYEIGGVYFVRDGNHRVSVASASGVEFIDAEVTSLATYFSITPDMTMEALEAAVIEYERQRFNSATAADDVLRGVELRFTAAGRYDVILSQLRAELGEGVTMADTLRRWYEEDYLPLVEIIRSDGLLRAFPDRTESDLYVWILQHWELLKRRYGVTYPAEEAVQDFRRSHRRSFPQWLAAALHGRRPSGRGARE
jgi:hypothetical protein